MEEYDLKADLTAIGGIFISLILLFLYIQQNYINAKNKIYIQNAYLETTHELIKLKEQNESLNFIITRISNDLEQAQSNVEYYQKLTNIKEDLRNYSTKEQAIGLALDWTESRWGKFLNHNSSATERCGIKPEFWQDYLNERNIDINSTAACIEVYNYYYEQTNSQHKAIKLYKGIESKKHSWLVSHTLELINIIEKKLKEKTNDN